MDCLNNWKYDGLSTGGKICTQSKEMEIVRNPWESISYNSSISIKMRFMGLRDKGIGRLRILEGATADPTGSAEGSSDKKDKVEEEPYVMYGELNR